MIWLEVLPAVSAVVTVAGISFKAGQILQKLNHNTEDIKEIRIELKDLDKRVIIIETKISGSSQKIA